MSAIGRLIACLTRPDIGTQKAQAAEQAEGRFDVAVAEGDHLRLVAAHAVEGLDAESTAVAPCAGGVAEVLVAQQMVR